MKHLTIGSKSFQWDLISFRSAFSLPLTGAGTEGVGGQDNYSRQRRMYFGRLLKDTAHVHYGFPRYDQQSFVARSVT